METINLKEGDIQRVQSSSSSDEEETPAENKLLDYNIKVGNEISYNGKTGIVKIIGKRIIILEDGTRIFMKNK